MEGERERGEGLDDGGNSINHPMPINARDLAKFMVGFVMQSNNYTVQYFISQLIKCSDILLF